jgi:hypothetical protein
MSPQMAKKWHAAKTWCVEFVVIAVRGVHELIDAEPRPLDSLPPEIHERLFDNLLRGAVAGKTLTQILITLSREDLTPEQQALANELINIIDRELTEGMAE